MGPESPIAGPPLGYGPDDRSCDTAGDTALDVCTLAV